MKILKNPAGLWLLTMWPCVVKASYLLGIPQRYELLRWVELDGVIVYPFGAHHLAVIGWMENYTDYPPEGAKGFVSILFLANRLNRSSSSSSP